jgi:hypothetical protein
VAQVPRLTEAITANQNPKAAATREGNPEEGIRANLNSAGVARQGGTL